MPMVELKITLGLSINMLMISYVIYVMQSIYNLFSYMYNPPFSHDEVDLVHVLASFHNQLLVAAQIVMILYYPRLYNKLHPSWMGLILAVAGLLIFTLVTEGQSGKVVEAMDTAMVIDSFFKSLPQVLLSLERKSTSGFSITAVHLDLWGTILTFFGYVLKNIANNESKMFVHSMSLVKFILLLSTLGFQITYLVQHYILYGDRENNKAKTEESSDDTLIKSSKRVAEQKNRLKLTAVKDDQHE